MELNEVLQSIYGGCEIIRCRPGSKRVKTYRKKFVKDHAISDSNRCFRNGTGGLLAVDLDGKNQGKKEELFSYIPGIQEHRTLAVKTPSADSWHYLFRLPDGFRIKTGELLDGVEIPTWSMLPGSQFTFTNQHGDVETYTYRFYDHEQPILDAPETLLLLIEAPDGEEALEHPEHPNTQDYLEHLLRKFSTAPRGKRNEVYLEVAMPVMSILEEKAGTTALVDAYPGQDKKWIKDATKSTAKKIASEGAVTVSRNRNSRRARALLEAYAESALMPFTGGKTGTLDRRILMFVAQRCWLENTYRVSLSTGTIAIYTGTQPRHVRASLKRLRDLEWVYFHEPRTGKISLNCSEWGRIGLRGGSTYERYLSNLCYLIEDQSFNPLAHVWISDYLSGRHGHVFTAIASGVRSAAEIARIIGCSKASVSVCLEQLERSGLVVNLPDGWQLSESWRSIATVKGREGRERVERVRERVERDLVKREEARELARAKAEQARIEREDAWLATHGAAELEQWEVEQWEGEQAYLDH